MAEDDVPSAPESGESSAGPAELDSLTPSGREVLAVSQEVLKEFQPQVGVLDDLPQLTVEPGDAAKVCRRAKEDLRLAMRQLLCLACVDYKDTLQVVYFLHSLDPDRVLVIKANVPVDDPRLPSVAPVWQAAAWYEREAHDLYGVAFDGHPDLSPLLLYEGFEGYPGRRDFPFNDYQEF